MHKLTNPQTIIHQLQRKKKDFLFWIIGILLTFIVLLFISSKIYSFLLPLSSYVQAMSFLIMFIKVYSFQNISGISINSLITYSIVLICRLCATFWNVGYLPTDSSGDWFYQMTEVVSFVICVTLVYMIIVTFKGSSDIQVDSVSFVYLTVPTLILAILIHPSANNNLITDILWTYSMYLEAFALFPQIYLFQKKGGQIESYTSHYVSLQGLSRLFSLIFWYDTFIEFNQTFHYSYSLLPNYCGHFIILSQFIQLVLMLDYYYLYFKSIMSGQEMSIKI